MKSGEGAKSRTPLVCPHFAAWHCDVRVSQRRTHPSIDVLRGIKKKIGRRDVSPPSSRGRVWDVPGAKVVHSRTGDRDAP